MCCGTHTSTCIKFTTNDLNQSWLTAGPGGPTLPAEPGNPVAPWEQNTTQSVQIRSYFFIFLKPTFHTGDSRPVDSLI